jgi:formate dehydrogenase subunit gamma
MQPAAPAPMEATDEIREELRAIIAQHLTLEGPMLPILHAIQEAFGHVPQASVTMIAEALNLSKAEVHGVISFYHDFRSAPAGRRVVKICRAEACKSVGGDAVAEATLRHLGVDWHGTTADGAITIEPVYCLGLCACAPSAMVGGKLHGRVTEAKMHELIAEARA